MGGFVITGVPDRQTKFEGKITFYLVICAVIAATGGLMFGYDIGISGGVTSMDSFLLKFFPSVYYKKKRAKEDNYCKYDDHKLQLFTSSLYLAALVSCFFASAMCRRFGRKLTIQISSVFFFIGVILNVRANDLHMLIAGRILLGIGVGFANQAVPLFLSEIAPFHIRGGLNILFQLNITIGILVANVVNYYASKSLLYGWKFSLGLAGVPALILCIGSFLITETPTSLIQHGRSADGLEVLKKIRGTHNVEAEFQEILQASEAASLVERPFMSIFHRSSFPQLVIGSLLQFFQQFTGINAIMFYAPVLFEAIGFKSHASLLSAVAIGTVNLIGSVVSLLAVDKVGRKLLLLEGCLQMFLSMAAIGAVLVANGQQNQPLDNDSAMGVVMFAALFVSGFAWSWGPLAWLIPSEIFPLETRTAGYAVAVSSNMLFTFVIAQIYLSMLCRMRAGVFFFFSMWIAIMGIFVAVFLPETKNIPMDEMVARVWKKHWYWKRYMDDGTRSLKMEALYDAYSY
ncbi:Sugar transport protein 8 [Rhynchospora pubera]|uniref:Sugar transport protein 8 n=1 Tax=Rhynchospora pubera TaxID=906938 RepID=A0AAV8H3T8_9POAL|nr:Sugar transport protein 8 [Rhynchospora pubera]